MSSSLCCRLWLVLLAGLSVLVPMACTSDGHLDILGYTTRPMYDPGIKTVRVPIFKNDTYRQRLEFYLTEAVIREIESKTPLRVVPAGQPADTELLGKVTNWGKQVIVFNQLGLVRTAQTTMSVEMIWKDLRPKPAPDWMIHPLGGSGPIPTSPPPEPVPVLVQSMGEFRPEIGESLETAEKEMMDRMAVNIISMMEHPW